MQSAQYSFAACGLAVLAGCVYLQSSFLLTLLHDAFRTRPSVHRLAIFILRLAFNHQRREQKARYHRMVHEPYRQPVCG